MRPVWGQGVVEIRLLGPVEVWVAGRRVPAGPPQQRTVLAALAVEADRPVPVERVIDRVWAEDSPAQARVAVAGRITHIRQLLADAASAEAGQAGQAGHGVQDGPVGGSGRAARAGPVDRWVAWRSDGYVLRLDPDRVDLLRFRRLAADARRGERSDAERVGLLAEALGLWRGVPLAGLRGEWAARMRDSWRLERLEAALEWGRAALRLGQHAGVIPVARELTEEYPHNEALAVVLVSALAADGRRGEAADHCKTVSQRLRTELGTDPGLELRELQRAVLNDQPLRPGPPSSAPPATPPAVPAQLPGDVRGFAGRAEHLARLDTVLAAAAAEAPTAVVIIAVSGTAGVGKTALAVHWAHQVRHRFPDGQLYVNLRGYDPSGRVLEPAAAVRRFIDALGVPGERIPPDLDAQTALYRSLLSGKRVLVVVDNARDAEHARPLLPGTPTALALVTSRDQLTGLVAADGAHPLTLDLLTYEEAAELLARRLPDRVAAEPAAVEEIITRCARLPLALSIAAARAQQSTFPLTTIAAELADAGGRLGRLDADDILTQVRAVFSWSYTALTPDAARLFRLLGLHPGPDTSVPAAASLAGHPPHQTRPLLTELTRANLLTEHAPGRYACHDLLRAYATDLTHTDPADQRRAAIGRVLDHYLHTAYAADRLLNPTRDPIPLAPPAAGASPEHLADHQEAMAWLTAEHPALLAALQHAAETGLDTRTWQLAWALDTFLDRRGHWHDLAAVGQAALRAADRLCNPPARAQAHRRVARADTRLGRYPDAHTNLLTALDLYAQTGDHDGQARTHQDFSGLWDRRGRPDLALGYAQHALALHRAAGRRRGQAWALNAVGWHRTRLGDHTQALTHCGQALTLLQELGDRGGEAAAWDSLGYAHHHLGHHTQAVDCYQHALALLRDMGNRYQEGDVLTHLGDTHHTAGDSDSARAAWQHALDILTDLDHPDADAIHTKLRDLDLRTPGPEDDRRPGDDQDGGVALAGRSALG